MPNPKAIAHPHLPDVTLYPVARTCPVPGFGLSFGDGVIWKGKAYVINSMHYLTADFKPAASLVDFHRKEPGEVIAPLDELRVFDDARPYAPNPT